MTLFDVKRLQIRHLKADSPHVTANSMYLVLESESSVDGHENHDWS